MSKKHRKFNLEIAIQEGENIGIPRLLDAEDFYKYRIPEEKSTLLLLSEFVFFSSKNKILLINLCDFFFLFF